MRTQQPYYHLLATVLFLSLVFQHCGQPNEGLSNMVASNASERPIKTPTPVLSTSYGPFTSASGAMVTLQQTEGRWHARVVQEAGRVVHEHLEVGCAGDIPTTVSQLQHQPSSYIKTRVHVLSPAQSPIGKRAIYLGRLGLRGGMDSGDQEHDTATSIHQAATQGDLRRVKYLVEEKGADVNAKTNDGRTAVHYAALEGPLELLKYLVEEKGADVNVKGSRGGTALHHAARKGQLEPLKYLVEKGADVNAKNNLGRTTVRWAARGGHLETMLYLIEEAGGYNPQETVDTQSSWFSQWEHIGPYVKFIALADTLFSAQGCQGLRREAIQEITDEARGLKLGYKGEGTKLRKECPHDLGTAFSNRFKSKMQREGVPEAMLLGPEKYFEGLLLPDSLKTELQKFVNYINEGRQEFIMHASSLVALLESTEEESNAISPTPLDLIVCPREGFSAYNPEDSIQKQTVTFYTQRSRELATLILDGENVRSEIDSGEIKRAQCKYLWTHLSQWGPHDATFKALVKDGVRKGQVVAQIVNMLKGPTVVLPTELKTKLEQTLKKLLTPDVPKAVEELQEAMQ